MSLDDQSPQPSAARDSNVVSVVTMALGAVSVAIGPIFGPLAIAAALFARRRGERLARKALIVALAGFAIGLAIAIAVISSRN